MYRQTDHFLVLVQGIVLPFLARTLKPESLSRHQADMGNMLMPGVPPRRCIFGKQGLERKTYYETSTDM